MSFEEGLRQSAGKRRLAMAPFAALLLWVCDNHAHQRAALGALTEAGYGERTVAPSRRWRCHLGRGTEFWAQGGRIGRETTGYVCTSHILPARIYETPDIDFNPFRDI